MTDNNNNINDEQNQVIDELSYTPLSSLEHAVIEKAAKSKLRKKGRNFFNNEDLSITSLMDALTILLVFLLVTLTSDPLNVKQDAHLLLAKSTSSIIPEDAIPIIISKSYISVDQKDIVKVECKIAGRDCDEQTFERKVFCDIHPNECSLEEKSNLKKMYFFIDKSYKENADESSFLIVPLLKALEDKVKSEKEENKDLGRDFKGNINLMCDHDIPFRLITEIVYTAGLAELSNIRFATILTNKR